MSIKNTLVHLKTAILPVPFGLKDFKIKGNVVTYTGNGKSVKFSFRDRHTMVMTLGSILEIFQNRDYERLKVNDKVVVDIGGYIGDTALFFISEGAEHVFSYEPNPDYFAAEKANVGLNGMSDKVTLFQEQADLRSILSAIGQRNALVLKMDCEGCEYSQITEQNIDLLNRFEQIMLEYHNGPDALIKILQKAGFKTWNTAPKRIDNMSLGYIYAWKEEPNLSK